MCWTSFRSKRWRALATAVWLAACIHAAPASDTSHSDVGGDFTLNSVDGPVALSDLKGKVVLLFFGYTSCPDICPMSLARISACLSTLPAEQAENVRGLFVTLDPSRDSAERTQQYAGFFHDNIVGLSGTPAQIDGVATQYGISYERKSAPETPLGYTISHPTGIYLIDTEGTLVGEVAESDGLDALRAEVEKMLDEDF